MSKIGSVNIGTMYLGSTKIGKAYLGSSLVYELGGAPEPTPDHVCLTFRSSSSNTISLTCNGTAAPTLYYSQDGTTWTQWDYSEVTFMRNVPFFLYGSNTTKFSSSQNNYVQFVIGGTGNVSCSGSIATLINGTNTLSSLPSQYCFYKLFHSCDKLVSAPSLPSTTLKTYCYRLMFYGCANLVEAPVLPATTMTSYCYQQMFRGCTSLVNAPDLPATTLVNQCYSYMFYGCSSLQYVKAMFTTTPSTTYTNSWMSNVKSGGTFVKNSAATWTNTGSSAIPTSWTIEYASS